MDWQFLFFGVCVLIKDARRSTNTCNVKICPVWRAAKPDKDPVGEYSRKQFA